MRKLEVITLNVDDSVNAEKAGADRLELVANIYDGGLSPQIELVQEVVSKTMIPVNVMVRFKKENYVYNKDEFNQIVEYINELKHININGIVFGSLNIDDSICLEQLERLKEINTNFEITFHRAIDENELKYIENIKKVENLVNNILTSGCLENPIEKNVTKLSEASKHNVNIIVGGGITNDNYKHLMNSLLNCDFHIGKLAYNNCDFTQGINEKMIKKLKKELNRE